MTRIQQHGQMTVWDYVVRAGRVWIFALALILISVKWSQENKFNKMINGIADVCRYLKFWQSLIKEASHMQWMTVAISSKMIVFFCLSLAIGMPRSNMDGAVGGADNKSFCSKPSRGWSHSDNVITNEGVAFNVRVRQTFAFRWSIWTSV